MFAGVCSWQITPHGSSCIWKGHLAAPGAPSICGLTRSCSLKSAPPLPSARVRREHLPEVIVARGWLPTQACVGDIQQCPVLLVLTEIIGAPWRVVTDHPGTSSYCVTGAEERVEGSRLSPATRRRVIGRRDQCTAHASKAVADCRILNARHISLEGEPIIVHIVTAAGERATKVNRRWMQIGVPIRPHRLVGCSIKTRVAENTT